MNREFPKSYEPQNIEEKWYELWMNNGIYKANNKSEKPSYSILLPPPNVTGILHFGHVLNITLQDLYIRRKRMDGFEVCWFPGIDHAGIATQSKVESEIKKDGLTRYDLGREKFVEKVWEWKEKYGGIILKQMRKLGVSVDWDRTLFTMDESASNAVQEVFIRLFDEGLIYRGKRIINWSPLAQTALSDEEVEFREVKEHFYTMRYYFENETDYLMLATARPETIYGDIAVAVNPNDERYKNDIGKKVRVPLVNRWVEIISDEYADPEFGTGCVKITPAHDPNDFMVGQRHNLEIINTLNPDGTLNENTGEYNGLDRFEARKRIVEKLKEQNLIEKIEDYTHNVGFSQRGGEPVEPYLSDQWFVKMQPLTEQALEMVTNGEIKFHPAHWVKTYEHWMTGIRDWCISRQLWWGHRIPVYYAPDGRLVAADSAENAAIKLGLPADTQMIQDTDVLDTWFSSWLWPLTTMHWLEDGKTEETDDLNYFLPSDLLVTAPEIIFFWVARMIMATSKFKKQIPFKDVYFTSIIRDGQGRKLSKSLGNSPDPLNIIAKYGCDAVRYSMVFLSPLGQDVRMDVDVEQQDIAAMEIGRNFCNKIWNAGRFILMKNDELNNLEDKNGTINYELSLADKWILSRFNSTIDILQESLDNFKVTDYAKVLYDFIWRDFCDWYIEIFKIQSNMNNDFLYRSGLNNFVLNLYDGILKLIHPIMPFISEEIWHLINNKDESESISLQDNPKSDKNLINTKIEADFELLQLVVEEIRKLRAGSNIPPSKKLPITLSVKNDVELELFNNTSRITTNLGRAESLNIAINAAKPDISISSVVRDVEVFVEVGSAIDIEQEKARLQKEISRMEGNISGSEKKLSNEKFVQNASPQIVAAEKEKLESMKSSLEKVKENLRNLG